MKVIKYILVFLIYTAANAQSEITSENLLLMNDSIQLPGTLTFKKGLKKQPLVIFIQGSGNPDRNGNQLALGVKANYIKTLRDSLNKNDIAFYSYDKRNVTPANIPIMQKRFVFEDLVKDAEMAITEFSNDDRFSSIILLGHSQGSLVGMLAINEKVDAYISLAGIGESVDKTIVRQIGNQNDELGKIAKSHFEELKETGTIKDTNPMLVSIFAKPNLEFLKSYMSFNPEEEIKQLNLPTLIINGTKDIQVPVSDAKALHKANANSKLAIIDKMNHVLKIIEDDNDNLTSYASADFPISEELIKVITEFIKK